MEKFYAEKHIFAKMTEFWIQPICGDAADKAFLCDQLVLKSKKISNDEEQTQSDPISCPLNRKGKNQIHKLTAVYERHAR